MSSEPLPRSGTPKARDGSSNRGAVRHHDEKSRKHEDPMSDPDDTRIFTQAEIKAAFWKVFHESGDDWWFPYERMGASKEDCDNATEGAWQEFLEALGAELGQHPRDGGIR